MFPLDHDTVCNNKNCTQYNKIITGHEHLICSECREEVWYIMTAKDKEAFNSLKEVTLLKDYTNNKDIDQSSIEAQG